MFQYLVNWLEYQRDHFGSEFVYDSNDLDIIRENFTKLSQKSTDNVKINSTTIERIDIKKGASTILETWSKSTNLNDLHNSIKNCKECELGHSRLNFVFGTGNPKADIMIIGEAPGADEDEQGLPFVGRAGQLLTNMLEAIQIKREDVFIANILKCRPPNNRRPSSDEINECEPYLQKQIDLIKPKLILVLGLTAVSSLLKVDVKMSEIRGSVLDYRGYKILITYHPAALLRNPNWKKPAWEDLKLLKKLLEESK